MTTASFGISLIAKAPYPPFGERRTSKNSVLKRVSARRFGGREGGEEDEAVDDKDRDEDDDDEEEEKEEKNEDGGDIDEE